jgi:glycosyltransferase involved in cell wall biosynthesis
MNILVNSSNAKGGGGIQVTDSICCLLNQYPRHHFIVVLSSYFSKTKERIADYSNVTLIEHNISNSFKTLLFGRDSVLDGLVEQYAVDAVLTVFGPSRWQPRCPHLCGFARPHLVLPDSPFFAHVSLTDRLRYKVWTYFFRKSSKVFYTENPFISKRFQRLMGNKVKVHTVTNYYNQVYDHPEQWGNSFTLPPFEGTTLLTISSWNEHKNFPIMVDICRYMERHHPDFSFRFVLTIPKDKASFIPEEYLSHFVILGPVDVSECPHLYEQADIMLLPSLLECFSATYPEAMRMEVPIVTTDLEFAKGLCGDAACYYSAVDGKAAADAIYHVVTDKPYAQKLVELGKEQLKHYDNYEQRTAKLMALLEKIAIRKT